MEESLLRKPFSQLSRRESNDWHQARIWQETRYAWPNTPVFDTQFPLTNHDLPGWNFRSIYDVWPMR